MVNFVVTACIKFQYVRVTSSQYPVCSTSWIMRYTELPCGGIAKNGGNGGGK